MATRAKLKLDHAIVDTFTVAATKTATLGQRVRLASADGEVQDCAAGEDGIGVALTTQAAGEKVGVVLDGHAIAKVKVGTGGATRGKVAIAVADGFTDMLLSNGKDTQYPAGKFLQSGVAGDLVGMLLMAGEGGRSPYATAHIRVRNVVNANVADLTAYTVAANASNNDNVLGVANDLVLLIAQTTAAQNGVYKLGTVSGGTCALTRISEMPAAAAFLKGSFIVEVTEGDLFAHTSWKNTAAGTVATDDPLFFPGRVVREAVLVAGTITITNIPILSATKTAFAINRKVANTSTATTGGYVTNGAPTPGKLGTASVEIMAAVAAGTINNADISTLEVAVINW